MRNFSPPCCRPVSLCDVLDRALSVGVVASGEMTISVADVDLLYLGLQLVITSIQPERQENRPAHDPPCPPLPSAHNARGLAPAASTETRPGWTARAPSAHPPPAPLAPAPASASLRPAEELPKPEASRARGSDPNKKNGLAQLVMALIKALHELLQRQALRRMEAGSLSVAEMERLGVALLRQTQEIERLAGEFGFEAQDLNLDLGPLGKLL